MKLTAAPEATQSMTCTPAPPWTWGLLQAAWFVLPVLPGIGTVGFGVVMLATWRQQWRQLLGDRQLWGWGLLSLWLMISASFAAQPGEAWLGLANLIPFFLLLAALRVLLRSPAQLRRLAWLGLYAALPVVGLGLGQVLFGWTTPSFWYTLLGWRLVAGGNPSGRMASSFMYANLLAFYLAIVWTLGLGLAANQWQIWRQQQRGGRLLLVILASLAAIALALVLTHSRNAWLLATVTTLAFAIYEGWSLLLLAVVTGIGTVAWAAFCHSGGASIAALAAQIYLGTLVRRSIPASLRGGVTGNPMAVRLADGARSPLVGLGPPQLQPALQSAVGFLAWSPAQSLPDGAGRGRLANAAGLVRAGWQLHRASGADPKTLVTARSPHRLQLSARLWRRNGVQLP